MPLSSYRMHRIYLAATMNYGLGSDDPEELAYYNKIRKEMDDMKKEPVKKGIPLNWDTPKEWINESEYFFINWWESDAHRTTFTDDPEGQKEDSLSYFLTAKVTPITAVMSFLIVEVS